MGEFLSEPNKEKHSEDKENEFVRYGSCGMQGWRKRMEDAHITDISLADKRFEIFGVFDGHGGKEVSQFVKEIFTKTFLTSEKLKVNDVKGAIEETFLKMDILMEEPEGKSRLAELAKISKAEDEAQDKKLGTNNLLSNMIINKSETDVALMTGCTACVCVIDETEKKIYFANSGDSRVVLCKNGTAYRMSLDHKPDLEIEKNRITKAEGWISDGRVKGNLNLSRGFGDLEYKGNKNLSQEEQMITAFPDIVTEELTEDDQFIIIGCDGIWDCLQDQQACDFVKKRLFASSEKSEQLKVKISGILEKMLDEICAKDVLSESGVGCDNMTCLVIQFKHNK